ncbi:MAG: LuxR C-terminal-related transcriptional regulator [Litorilinea sp.]
MEKRQPARADSQPAQAETAASNAHASPETRTGIPESSAPENPLSEREMDVARLLTTGATNSEIARELTISPHTVKVHLRNVFEKLQVSSRTEASMVLLQRGWVVVPGLETPGVETPGALEAQTGPVAPPVPPPLADQPAGLAVWQRIYLGVAVALCLVAAFTPYVLGRPRASFALLSDAGQTVIGRPAVELLPRWEARTPLSQARSRMAVAMDSQAIYVVGGEASGGRLLQSVDTYDLQVNQWHQLAPLPFALANSTAAIWENRLYVAGGVTPTSGAGSVAENVSENIPENVAGDEVAAGAQPAVEAAEDIAAELAGERPATGNTPTARFTVSDALLLYDGALQTWRPRGALPVPLAGAHLLADSSALYLLGGWDGETMRDEVWAWTPDANTPAVEWRLITRLPVPMAFFGATLVDGALYVAGGYDGQNELAQVHRYRLETARWEALPPLTVPRGGLTLAHDGVALLALGGGWTRPISDHERFDAGTNQWTTFASPIPGEWRHLAAVSREGVIHLLGGWSGDYLDTHLQYQSSFRALLPMITTD